MQTNADFDWVKARAGCSLGAAFQQLRLGVERDIEIRNSLRPAGAAYKFETGSVEGAFTALVDGGGFFRFVEFKQSGKGISVKNNSEVVFLEATLTLSDDGICRLKVQGVEREFWQFRRMALEALFFDFV